MMIIHDRRLPAEYINALKGRFPYCEMWALDIPGGRVYSSILCHPDIYFFSNSRDILFHAPCVPAKIIDRIREQGINVKEGVSNPSGEYPDTVKYNAVRVGDVIFSNIRYIDPLIIEAAGESGADVVHVEQGYSRCAVVPVGEKGLITADEGIAFAAEERGFDVLRISRGHILLPGEKYGFIGGACGVVSDGSVCFLGDIALHSDGKKIKGFLKDRNIGLVDMPGLPLYDAGSLIICG